MHNSHRALIGTAVSALLLFGAVSPVAAAEAISIPWCAGEQEDGTYHGSYLASAEGTWTITETWQAKTRKQINQFLNRTTLKVWFDGVRVYGNWSAPYPYGGLWRTTWTRDQPAQDKLVAKTRLIFNQRLTDGYYWYRAGQKGPPLVCDIYGVY